MPYVEGGKAAGEAVEGGKSAGEAAAATAGGGATGAAADFGAGTYAAGAAGDAAAGTALAGAASTPALIDSAAGTTGYGASSAGLGGGASALGPDALATAGSLPASSTGASFLPVTSASGSGVGTLSPELQQSLGIVDASGGGDATFTGVGGSDVAAPSAVDTGAPTLDATGTQPAYGGPGTPGAGAASEGAPGFGQQVTDGLSSAGGSAASWIEAHPAQAAMLGLSGVQALSKPKLPSAATTALSASSTAVQQAQGILSSGGTSSPQWQTTKASIDSSIDEQVRNETEAIIQAAQNNGQGGRDSAVVQQRIGQLQQTANAQKQQQYNAALTQIVSSAVSELSGGNATLGSIAQMQMSQSSDARAAASQTAELALLLGSKGG